MSDNQYYLGVDGGASKTRVMVINEEGKLIDEVEGPSSNIHNIPAEEAIENIIQTTKKLKKDSYQAICFAMAGLDSEKDKHILSKSILENTTSFLSHELYLCNDTIAGFYSGSQANQGVCLIAGTGANCYGFNENGLEHKAGNWGYLIGGQGSSFAIGQAIIKRAMQEYDGRIPTTSLSQYVLDHYSLHSLGEVPPLIFQSQNPVKTIASLSQLCTRANISQDTSLFQITKNAILAMEQSYKAVISKIKISSSTPFDLVLIGGLFNSEHFIDAVKKRFKNITPKVVFIRPEHPPAYGAAILAKHIQNNNIQPLPSIHHLTE